MVEPLPPSVTEPFDVSSYATNAFVILPELSVVAPSAYSCAPFTASVLDAFSVPFATFVS